MFGKKRKEVLENIIREIGAIAPEPLKTGIQKCPVDQKSIREMVYDNVAPNPDDQTTVKIYSILWGMSEESVKENFIDDFALE